MKILPGFTKTLLKGFSVIALIFITLCSYSQVTEKNYKIYSSKLGKEVSLDEVVTDFKNYDVLFYGEEHNDSVTHYLESKLFELLYKSNPGRLALSMEMFDRDVQTVMNEYLSDAIRERNFTKDARVWSNYKDYRPMVEFAKLNKVNLVCANAPSRYTNLAGRKGQKALLSLPDAKSYIAPLPYDTASGNYYKKLLDLTHGTGPSMGGFSLIQSQSLWDATMAWSISSYMKKLTGMKMMQVNGRFHSDEGFAIVTQLKKYSPRLKSLILSAGSDDSFPNIDWGKFKHLGDYVIITDPKVPRSYK